MNGMSEQAPPDKARYNQIHDVLDQIHEELQKHIAETQTKIAILTGELEGYHQALNRIAPPVPQPIGGPSVNISAAPYSYRATIPPGVNQQRR